MTDETATPTPRQVLDLPLEPNSAGAATVRDYLVELLATLWCEGGNFSGKRPFGDSGWRYEVYPALITAGYVTGRFDEYGLVEDCDTAAADRLVDAAIRSLTAAPEPLGYAVAGTAHSQRWNKEEGWTEPDGRTFPHLVDDHIQDMDGAQRLRDRWSGGKVLLYPGPDAEVDHRSLRVVALVPVDTPTETDGEAKA